jgi:hypothetical protein
MYEGVMCMPRVKERWFDNNEYFNFNSELTYKENRKVGFLSRIKFILLAMMTPCMAPFLGIMQKVESSLASARAIPNIRITVTITIGIVLFFLVLPFLLLGLALAALYALGESLIMPFTYLYAAIKDIINLKNDDFTIKMLSRTHVKVEYNFKNHIFKHPFDQIDSRIDTLDLSSNKLEYKPIADLVNLLKAIPLTIRHLNLANNSLDRWIYTEEELREIYEAVPRHLLSLNLSGNRFPNEDHLFTALPRNLVTLQLNACGLDGQKLSSILPLLPETLTSLEVMKNPAIISGFGYIQGTLACKELKLNLSHTVFTKGQSRSLQDDCTDFLTALPKEITSLDFRGSGFLKYLDNELVLPKQLTELGLNISILASKQKMLQECRLKSIKLKLPDDNSKRNSEHNSEYNSEHKERLKQIPKTVTTLDLSNNQLGNLETDELLSLLGSIPEHIRVISLDHNELFHGKTIPEADELFKKMHEALPVHPEHGKPTVHLNKGNGYSSVSQFGLFVTPSSKLWRIKFPADNRQASLQQIPKSVTTLDLSDNQLGELNNEELLTLLGHIPDHIRVVILDNNELFNNKSRSEAEVLLRDIRMVLPSHPQHGKPTLHLNIGNRCSFTSNSGEPKSTVQHLPHQVRSRIYEFLGGRETLDEVEIRREQSLATFRAK